MLVVGEEVLEPSVHGRNENTRGHFREHARSCRRNAGSGVAPYHLFRRVGLQLFE